MKSIILTTAFLVLFATPGCNSSQQEQPPENYGWQPPPTQEERHYVYGEDAPEYPTVQEAIKQQDQ